MSILLHAPAEHELRLPHVAILAALSDFGPRWLRSAPRPGRLRLSGDAGAIEVGGHNFAKSEKYRDLRQTRRSRSNTGSTRSLLVDLLADVLETRASGPGLPPARGLRLTAPCSARSATRSR